MKSIIAIILATALTACGGVKVTFDGSASGEVKSEPVAPTPPKPIPTVALTFDYYGSTYTNAYPLLKSRGLVGTFFVDPDTVDNGQPTTAQLNDMRTAGWSIQGYSGVNMTTLNANDALIRMNSMKATMAAKGFPITSIAPTSRAWNQQLRDLAQGVFTSVRSNSDTSAWQSYPIPDPLYVKQGATASLSGTDTAASLSAQLDSLEAGTGLWVVVVHKVGDDSDPVFSIPSATFGAFLDRLAADTKAGKVRVTTFDKSLTQAMN